MPQNPNQPFSEYLTAPVQPQTPAPTGYESLATAGMLIGKNLLDGFRQGRLQKAAQIEQENEKAQRSLEGALEYLSNLKDADPEVIEPYKAKLTQQYLQMIGSSKESSKDTGNPLTDVFKNMAINLSGGPLPKQKGPIVDPNLINEAMLAAVNPENSRFNKMGKIASEITNLTKSVGIGDLRTAMTHEQIAPMISQYRRLAGDPEALPDSLRVLSKDPLAKAVEETEIKNINELQQGLPPSTGNIHKDYANQLNFFNRMKASKLQSKYGEPSASDAPKNVRTLDNPNNRSAIYYRNLQGHSDGYYDATTGEAIPGAYLASPEGQTYQYVSNVAGPDGRPISGFANRTNQRFTQLTDANGNPIRNAVRLGRETLKSVDATGQTTETRSSYDPYFIPNVIRQQMTQGTQSIPTAPTQTQPTQTTRVTQPVSSTTEPPIASPQSVNRPPVSGTPVAGGGRITQLGASEGELNDVVTRVRNGTLSREGINKQFKGNNPSRAVMTHISKNKLNTLSDKEIEGLNTVGSLSRIVPLYKELASVLPNEKRAMLQFVKGQLLNITGKWSNPRAKALYEAISPELSNIARGVSNELRPTDADALRMLGWGPDPQYNLDLNVDRIKRFENVLRQEFTKHSAGSSKEQILEMAKQRGPVMLSLFKDIENESSTPNTSNPKPKQTARKVYFPE